MSIESVKNEPNVLPVDANVERQQTSKTNQTVEASNVKSTDTLSLSEEAKNISPIMANINSDVYNKPEVLREVAMKLMQELYSEDNGTKV
ncbi:MAG: hypothetical protein EPN82_11060 [Bacteroidetes bacterium]|nr:MAG: hypothetical protein EPN82_11060 [Bacteroidota bacterium]